MSSDYRAAHGDRDATKKKIEIGWIIRELLFFEELDSYAVKHCTLVKTGCKINVHLMSCLFRMFL